MIGEEVLQRYLKTSEEAPLHLDSLGPCPRTVTEWVEQCERTGILEFPLLLTIATLNNSDRIARQTAVARVQDQALLASVAVEDAYWNVRQAAVERVDDQALLARIAVEDADRNVRRTAVERVDDHALLARIAVEDADPDVLRAAIERLKTLQP